MPAYVHTWDWLVDWLLLLLGYFVPESVKQLRSLIVNGANVFSQSFYTGKHFILCFNKPFPNNIHNHFKHHLKRNYLTNRWDPNRVLSPRVGVESGLGVIEG